MPDNTITKTLLQEFFVVRVTRIKSKIARECGIGMVGEVTAVAARQNPGMRGESAAGKWCGRHRDHSQVLPDFRERSIAIDCEQWVGGGGKCMEVETEDDGKGMHSDAMTRLQRT